MFKSLSLALVAGVIALQSPVRAEMNYEQKLSALSAKIDVNFSAILPFVKKAEGVNKLYQLVFESGSEASFSKTGLVKEVIIYEAFGNAPVYVANRSLLRDHTIFFEYTGSDSATILRELPSFSGELDEISTIERDLQHTFSGIILERSLSILYLRPNTNRSYLENLRALSPILKSSRYSAALAKFGHIWIQDSTDNANTIIQKYKYRAEENGKYVVKDGVQLRFGSEGLSHLRSGSDEVLVQQLLDIVLIHGFDQIDYFLETAAVKLLLANFTRFLTPERIATLKARKIARFHFTESWERESDLIIGDQLTLGVKYEDMEKIFNLIFGS